MPENTESDPEPDPDSESTDSVARRWQYTNDALAGLLLGSLAGLTAIGATSLIGLGELPDLWMAAYLTVAGVAAAWAFGSDALAAWRSND
jgi:hypothetical protein